MVLQIIVRFSIQGILLSLYFKQTEYALLLSVSVCVYVHTYVCVCAFVCVNTFACV